MSLESRLGRLRTFYAVAVVVGGVGLALQGAPAAAALLTGLGLFKAWRWWRPRRLALWALDQAWPHHEGAALRYQLPPGWAVRRDDATTLLLDAPGVSLQAFLAERVDRPELLAASFLDHLDGSVRLRERGPAEGPLLGRDVRGETATIQTLQDASQVVALATVEGDRSLVVLTYRELGVPEELLRRVRESLALRG